MCIHSKVVVYRTRRVIQQVPQTTTKVTQATTQTSPIHRYCCDVLESTNEYRSRFRLPKLVGDTRLDEAAMWQCKNLIKVGRLTHDTLGTTLSSRVTRVQYDWNKLAENILYEKGYGPANPFRAVGQWEDSPGHASNMRSSNSHIGSAFCESSSGRIYWVQVFGSGDSSPQYKYNESSCAL